MPKIDRILSDPRFFWRAKRQGFQKGRDVLFLRMRRESGISAEGIRMVKQRALAEGADVIGKKCRSILLPTIVGKPADNCRQAC